jgi:hypothetical protein
MIRIGEFSKLAHVPVPTLRYYDQLGLLTPGSVDRSTATATTWPVSCPGCIASWR